MSQHTLISVTTTDVAFPRGFYDEETGESAPIGGEGTVFLEDRYHVGNFSGSEWKLSVAEGFIILTNRNENHKIVVPAHRVREVEVTPISLQIVDPAAFTDGPVALVDADGREILGTDEPEDVTA